MKIVAMWGFFVCLFIFSYLEPGKPKRDRRFKTGYKNNEMPVEKTPETKLIQKIVLVICLIFAAIWFFSN